MKRFLAVLLLLAGCATAPDSVDRVIAAYPGKTIALAYYDLATGKTLFRNEREVFHAASTMKVPVMLGIFEAAHCGSRLSTTKRVVLWSSSSTSVASTSRP